MKRNSLPKFALTVVATAVALSMIYSAHAISTSLTYGDAYSLGSIEKGTPDNDTAQVAAINALLDLAAGNNQVVGSYQYDRTSNFQPGTTYPNATVVGTADRGVNVTSSLGSGYLYLLAKYGNNKVPGTDDTAWYVWYVGGLSGDVSVPSSGLSHVSLYNPGENRVPDGGMTVVLLGSALAGLGTIARRFKK